MIAFLDSGIGGLTILNACLKIGINSPIVYFADTKNCPYGNKSKKKISKIVLHAVESLINIGADIIVLACNTATAVAIKDLRNMFHNIKFIGTEPNINSPIKDNKKKILVLCTNATRKYCEVLKNKNENIQIFSPKSLASDIEFNKTINYQKMFKSLSCEKFDAVVLGCTHYIYKLKDLKTIFKNATFYASHNGVAKQLNKILNEIENFENSKDKQT